MNRKKKQKTNQLAIVERRNQCNVMKSNDLHCVVNPNAVAVNYYIIYERHVIFRH